MGLFKLESFAHDAEIRKGISKFESFEAMRENAFKDGVKSGAEAATRAYEAEKLRTLAPILEALNDMSFSQIEARQAMLNSLRPMIAKLVEAVLPQSAHHGLAAGISELVARACEKSPESRIVIFVAPDAVSAIQALLAPSKADFSVEPEPEFDGLQARIEWQGGYDQIDLDAALNEIRTAVDGFFSTTQKTGVQNA